MKQLFLIPVFFMGFLTTANAQIERQVVFKSSMDAIDLHGTLTIPKNTKGAVLLIVGSGKADRDETVSGKLTFTGKTEKLFAQLSDALVSAGYSTLRYDKRGVLDERGKIDPAIWKTADREHLITDAVDAAKFLSGETKVPTDQLVILGHSEGTIISIETALALGGKVKSVLLFGAQARSMREMLHFQIVEVNISKTSTKEETEKLEKEFFNALDFIANSKDDFAPDGKPINWYRQFLAAPANKDRAPLVSTKFAFFQGEADVQTPRQEIDSFLKSGIKNSTVFSYPGLGHGFSPEKNGIPTLGPVALKVREDLKNFVDSL